MRATVLAFIASALLASCAPAVETSPGSPDITGNPDSSANRIISLSPHLTELVFTAGGGDRLVGVVEHSDFPEPALEIPRVGDAFRVDFERIAELAPDLILAWEGGNPPELISALKDRGYRVVGFDPAGLASVTNQLETIAHLLGTEAQVRNAVDAFNARRAALNSTPGDDATSVFYQITAQPLYTIGGKHIISEIISECGGRNVFSALAPLADIVDIEAVVAADPAVILIGHDASGAADLWADKKAMAAVNAKTVYVLNADTLTRPTTRILDGMESVCNALRDARKKRAETVMQP